MFDSAGGWKDLAACRGHRTSDWYPLAVLKPENKQALKICWVECPVREECAAARGAEDTGIWGGVWWSERRKNRGV